MSTQKHIQHIGFNHRMVIVGFGSIAKAILPLLLRHIELNRKQVTVICDQDVDRALIESYGVNFLHRALTKDNYVSILTPLIGDNDFLLNLSVDVSSQSLIELCKKHNTLYLDTSLDFWPEEADFKSSTYNRMTNYAVRESILSLDRKGSTVIITHGANPGLISHFLKQALKDVMEAAELTFTFTDKSSDWARLAHTLGIKAIHIAEHDSQVSNMPKKADEFVNTWSVEGLLVEGMQPAELGWGTHERSFPTHGRRYEYGSQCAIYLNEPSASVRARSWAPLAGAFHGYIIAHTESIAIADFLTIKDKENNVSYRPTVHYVYSPCPDAILSLDELTGRNWKSQSHRRIITDSITSGMDELGILLLGHAKNAYWFGSQLTIQEARKLLPESNATSLQVASSVLAAVIWAIKNPREGIVEPEGIDHEFVLNIARPYLGNLVGRYSDWKPMAKRGGGQSTNDDDWQFENILLK